MTVGDLLAFSLLVGQLFQPVVRLSGAQFLVTGTIVASNRMFEVLDEPEPLRTRPPRTDRKRESSKLRFHNVSFAYGSFARNALEGINFSIEPETRVGLIGPSGSGKSTMLCLPPRLEELAGCNGSILVDGQDHRRIVPEVLRRMIGLVPQEAKLFNGTIRTNLVYAKPAASDADIWRALEITELLDWIQSLPMGVDTPVGERGELLSGGQRQRIALARAIIADPAVLLLDDSTSLLDSETESRIYAALTEELSDRTLVIVSNRVKSIRDCDQILVLEQGKVVEAGSHSRLMANGGYYAATYRQQTSSTSAGLRAE